MRRMSRMLAVGVLCSLPLAGGISGVVLPSSHVLADTGSGGGNLCTGPNLIYENLNPGPPATLTLQYQDSQGGKNPIAKIIVVRLKNGTESDNAPGDTVTVTLTKTNQNHPTEFDIKAVSKRGCYTETDPVVATVHAGQLLRLTHIARAEHRLLVSPSHGIRSIRVMVNGHSQVLRGLQGMRTVRLQHLHAGTHNTITVLATGQGSVGIVVTS